MQAVGHLKTRAWRNMSIAAFLEKTTEAGNRKPAGAIASRPSVGIARFIGEWPACPFEQQAA
jgi:hypothetical protein